MDTFVWYKVQWNVNAGPCSLREYPKLFHSCSAISGDRIVIFGGMHGEYAQSKELYCIKLEEMRVVKEDELEVEIPARVAFDEDEAFPI